MFYAVAVVNIVAGQKKFHALEQAFLLPCRQSWCPNHEWYPRTQLWSTPANPSSAFDVIFGASRVATNPPSEIPNLAEPNQDFP
jgi:hypothetical protein